MLGGTDFAFGGATTGMPGPLPNLLQQANLYFGSTGNVASPNALYVIEGRGNGASRARSNRGGRGRGTNGRVDRRFELMAA
jgi:outer membrane lipase/esterase